MPRRDRDPPDRYVCGAQSFAVGSWKEERDSGGHVVLRCRYSAELSALGRDALFDNTDNRVTETRRRCVAGLIPKGEIDTREEQYQKSGERPR